MVRIKLLSCFFVMDDEVCERCKPLFEQQEKRLRELLARIDELEHRLLVYENAHTPPSRR